MGFLSGALDGASVISTRTSHGRTKTYKLKRRSRSRSRAHHRSRSRSRSSSRDRGGVDVSSVVGSVFGLDGGHSHHHRSSSRHRHHHSGHHGSRSSFFGSWGRPSYYSRSSRHGFLYRTYRQLRRILKDLMHYAKRHPVKVFMLALMPLITGGALTAMLARFGLRLPPSMERMLGLATKAATGDSFGLMGEAVRMASDFGGGGGGGGGASISRGRDGNLQWERRSYDSGGDWGDGIMGVAKMFL